MGTRPLLLGPLILLAVSCAGRPTADMPQPVAIGDPLPMAAPWTPPTDWATLTPYEFAALVERALPEDAMTPLAPETYAELREALVPMDTRSVRAAIMLGRSRTDEAGSILSHRLAGRKLGPDRHSDAADVVLAASLARFPKPERFWSLMRLVEGEAPHPDFEVRVECACTALHIGFDRSIPFLLQVLRIGTKRGLEDTLDFTPPQGTAWARGRAATALSIRAGVPRTYQADAPLADREREAQKLEDLLADVIAKAALLGPRELEP